MSIPQMNNYFSNKTTLVTGGSSGIGYALSERLITLGATVIIVSDNASKVKNAVDSLDGEHHRVSGIVCDIGKQESVISLSEEVLARFGCPDILINNAGFATYRTFEESSLSEIERLASVNYTGAMRCTKVLLEHMINRGSGQIVNISSIAGTVVLTPNAVYCGAKHGMVAWSECLYHELRRFGIKVNVVCPGRVETPFFDHETFKHRAPRAETKLTVPIEHVVEKSLDAICEDRFITYIPRYLAYIPWLLCTFSPILKPLHKILLERRIKSFYSIHRTNTAS